MALIAPIAWFALVLQLYIMLENGTAAGIRPIASVVNFLSFFTILSNILVAACLTVMLLAPSSLPGRFYSKTTVQSAIALYIFIVGLVYNLVLRNIWSPTGWQLVADNLLHVAVPVLYVLYWFFFTPKNVLQWKNLLLWLVFPALYLVYSLVRGAVTGWYPYPFVHADNLGYGKVTVNSMLVLVAFVAAGSGMIALNRLTGKKNRLKS
ncbi:MAG: Pr6Pr family membrane protein [Bacteroidota bacterium]